MAPYEGAIKAVCYLLIIAAIGAGLYALHDSVYDAGRDAERVKWQGKRNQELADAGKKYAELQGKYREKERQFALDQAAITEKYRKEREDNDRKKNDIIARLRAGALVLRDPGAKSCGSAPSEVAASAAGSDEKRGRELSPELSEFLISEASRADGIVKKLSACQEIVESDRK